MLENGEYLSPIEGRVNKPQKANRELGIDTGFISGMDELAGLVPDFKFSYIRTSVFNTPFKVEMPAWLTKGEVQTVMACIFGLLSIPPTICFPVNLDIVDKVAKVPR